MDTVLITGASRGIGCATALLAADRGWSVAINYRKTIHAPTGDPDRARKLGGATPLGRPGRPEEVAEAILWLLSDASSYVTGSVVEVAGGI